jgi:hypothetical protein
MTKVKLTLAALATALLLVLPSAASAWVCRADGVGASATARSLFISRAKTAALRACQRRSLGHVCTIMYCR